MSRTQRFMIALTAGAISLGAASAFGDTAVFPYSPNETGLNLPQIGAAEQAGASLVVAAVSSTYDRLFDSPYSPNESGSMNPGAPTA